MKEMKGCIGPSGNWFAFMKCNRYKSRRTINKFAWQLGQYEHSALSTKELPAKTSQISSHSIICRHFDVVHFPFYQRYLIASH